MKVDLSKSYRILTLVVVGDFDRSMLTLSRLVITADFFVGGMNWVDVFLAMGIFYIDVFRTYCNFDFGGDTENEEAAFVAVTVDGRLIFKNGFLVWAKTFPIVLGSFIGDLSNSCLSTMAFFII